MIGKLFHQPRNHLTYGVFMDNARASAVKHVVLLSNVVDMRSCSTAEQTKGALAAYRSSDFVQQYTDARIEALEYPSRAATQEHDRFVHLCVVHAPTTEKRLELSSQDAQLVSVTLLAQRK